MAKELSQGLTKTKEITKACFEYVRDEIKHSKDYQLNPVTCKASEVLEYKTGYCYTKSHLLAALLRANGIPTGLCYQRLTTQSGQLPFCLHGLNAVYLTDIGWHRIDARGNKDGVDAEFTPPKEKHAFPIVVDGEADLLEIWTEPLPEIIRVLTSCVSYEEVANNLPDIELIQCDCLPKV
ncbi:transglutaminase family protein [Desulfocicer niacini]